MKQTIKAESLTAGLYVNVGLPGQRWAYHSPCYIVSVAFVPVQTPNGDRKSAQMKIRDRNGTEHDYSVWADSQVTVYDEAQPPYSA